MSTFGKRLHRLRTHRNLSLRQLAGATGIPYETISRIETGVIKRPAFDVAARLARALVIRLDYFSQFNDGWEEELTESNVQPADVAVDCTAHYVGSTSYFIRK